MIFDWPEKKPSNRKIKTHIEIAEKEDRVSATKKRANSITTTRTLPSQDSKKDKVPDINVVSEETVDQQTLLQQNLGKRIRVLLGLKKKWKTGMIVDTGVYDNRSGQLLTKLYMDERKENRSYNLSKKFWEFIPEVAAKPLSLNTEPVATNDHQNIFNKKQHQNASFVKKKTYRQSSRKKCNSNSKVDDASEEGYGKKEEVAMFLLQVPFELGKSN